ncbi:hypothetical protein DFS33DRAFT_1380588 [Desarmillaria ectypa]|nr:hypothetical protein DFS33DRAFT_1380588 [Desarmillaria ectypa]
MLGDMRVCIYLIVALMRITLFIGSFGSSIHASEDPFAVLNSISTRYVLVLAANICLVFNMGTDLVAFLSSPIEQSMAVILANSLGTGGIITFWAFVAILLFTVGIDIPWKSCMSFSYSVASVATAFMILMMVVFLFPTAPAPVAQSMNYTIVVVGEIITLAAGYYWISGRFWFTGPVITLADGSMEKRSNEKLSIKFV